MWNVGLSMHAGDIVQARVMSLGNSHALIFLTEYLFFADDTSIFLSHSDLTYLVSTTNAKLGNINVWMKINKLSVNIGRTNYIIFRPK